MLHLVDGASWVSLRSLPPKEAMVAVVLTDIAGSHRLRVGSNVE